MLAARYRCGVALLSSAVVVLSCNDSPTESDETRIPAALDIVSGDGQEGTVGTELSNPLVVRVEDANGLPVIGQLINFRVTSGGGSVFAGSGLTNTLGIVQDRWTLGTSTAQAQRVEARAVDPNTGAAIVFATFSATPLPGPAHAVSKVAGDGQNGVAGAALPESVAVRVNDQFGNPMPGVTVGWAVSAGNGAVSPAASQSNTQGIAKTRWTLGARLDIPHSVTATVGALTPATFSAQANPGPPSALTIVSGNAQTGVVGTTLSQALIARLTDALGNPIPGATVAFTVTSGGGSVTASPTTDADGHARATWTLGGALGTQSASAAIGSVSANFTATATVGPPATIVKVSGDAQSATIGQALSQPLVVRVEDQFGNDVPDVSVSWVVLAGGGSASPPNGSTNENGLATTQWTLGPVGGTHSMRAQVTNDMTATFTASALVPGGSALLVQSGDDQWGRVAMELQMPLMARLVDGAGQPLAGVTVTWTPSAGSANASASVTDAQGVASTRWTLGTKVETATMVASATGANSATFSSHVRPGPLCNLGVIGSGQTGVINQPLPQPLYLRPTDRYGNLTGPVSVSPTSQPGNNSGFLSGQLQADSNGVSQPVTWTLGSTVGQQYKTFSWIIQEFFCGPGIIRDVIIATAVESAPVSMPGTPDNNRQSSPGLRRDD